MRLRLPQLQRRSNSPRIDDLEGPRSYRDATVPPHFTWQEIEQLLTSVTGEDALALRDRAMLSLLCSYGLRIHEVVGLALDDIDPRHDRLQIVDRKGGSPLTLPLLEGVKATLAQYITQGRRPASPYHLRAGRGLAVGLDTALLCRPAHP